MEATRSTSSRGLPPATESETADQHPEKWSAHVDANQWPWICFERGENRNGGVFQEENEPNCERDFHAAPEAFCVRPSDQDREHVVNNNRPDEGEDVSADVMRSLDVGRRLRMLVQPHVAENGVPAPTDEEINDDKNPNDFVVDSNVHGRAEIIRFAGDKLQAQKF